MKGRLLLSVGILLLLRPKSTEGQDVGCGLVCQNGGSCVTGLVFEGVDACLCPLGMSGSFCEIDEQEAAGTLPQPISDPVCSVNICENGGTCRPTTGESGEALQACQCAPGFGGDLCEQDLQDLPCGDKKCQNGSKCDQSSAANGAPFCDCSTISTSDTHYAGKYCEYSVNTFCSDSKEYFCVNGGSCRNEGSGFFSCNCPSEWHGPSCEFDQNTRDPVYEECKLDCLHDGQCRKGAKSTAGIGEVNSFLAGSTHSEDNEHCVCKTRYTGLRCQYKYEMCGDREHMCLHGTKCVAPTETEPSWTCECGDSKSGDFCQHHRTTICPLDDDNQGIYMGMLSVTYCVNDGVCTQFERDGLRYPGCECPDEYTGPHCEFLKLAEQRMKINQSRSRNSAGAAAFVTVTCLLVPALIFYLYKKMKGQSNRSKEAVIEAAHVEEEVNEDEDGMMEEVDFDLEDIELY